MQIKIKEVYDREGKHRFETTLFEGDFIKHERVYFDTKDEFIKKYDDITKGFEGCVIGIPESYWFEPGDNKAKGYFVFIKYKNADDDLMFIVVMNRTIYITSQGQTIDVV